MTFKWICKKVLMEHIKLKPQNNRTRQHPVELLAGRFLILVL